MGYTYWNNGAITDFWPDNTEDTFYVTGTHSLQELIDLATEKFKTQIDLDKIEISSEYIQTSCLTYDKYDASDYTCFTVITLRK